MIRQNINRTEQQIRVSCDCGKAFRVKATAEGRKVRCPACREPILVQRDQSPDFVSESSDADLPANEVNELRSVGPDVECNVPPALPRSDDEWHDLADQDMPSRKPTAKAKVLPPKPTEHISRASLTTNLLLGGLLLVGSFVAAVLGTQFLGATEPATRSARTKWEYQVVISYDQLLEVELMDLGENGWELVNARRAISEYGPAQYEMIFRRPKQDG